MGVCKIPFKPSLLRLREAIDSWNNSSECLSPVSTPVTSTCSHSIGTLSALKIVLTDSATSAPIPSPKKVFVNIRAILPSSQVPTRDQGNCVFSSILCGLEDVGLNGCVCCSNYQILLEILEAFSSLHRGRKGVVVERCAARSKDCTRG